MTVLTSESTVKFFALNLTACDIISVSVEITEIKQHHPNSIFELRDKHPDSIPAMN